MHLGFATPVTLSLLQDLFAEPLPQGNSFAPAADWVRELIRRGHRLTLYNTSWEVTAPRTFHGRGLTLRIAPWRRQGTGRDRFRAERRGLRQLMEEDGCDLIHAHWTYEFALAALDAGIPSLITIHDKPWRVLANFRDMHRAARLTMAWEAAWRGRHFTAVSREAAAHFRRYIRPGMSIDVIPNGVPASLLQSTPAPRQGGSFVFATVLQGWTHQKNPRAAIRAFNLVRKENPAARLIMFGNGYESGGAAQQWAAGQGMEAGITFAGPLEYRELLRRIAEEVDVVVHPSRDESFSMTALEALAARKPFVAGRRTPGMREILDEGRAGMLVDVDDPEAIAAAMLQLMADPAMRERLADAGYVRVSTRYRLENVIGQYEELYRKILQGAGKGSGE